MPDKTFPESAVHHALLNTGLIANYRNLEGRLTFAGPENAVPDLAPEGVQGGCSTRIAILALEIAAVGSEIDGGAFLMRDAHAALHRIAGAAEHIHGLALAALNPGGLSPST